MKIEDVMTPCPYEIDGDATLDEALKKMQLHSVRHLPVSTNGNLVGVVSERDVRLSQIVCESSGFCPVVSQLCVMSPLIVDAGDQVARVAGEMADLKADCALVSKDNMLIGIFTTTDACRVLQRALDG